MRKALVALLALSPMMLNAQANTPANPQSLAKGQVLESKLNSPKGFVATEGAAPTSNLRISTGVTAPKVISTVSVAESNNRYITAGKSTMVISLIVEANGKPSDLKVVKSAGVAALDANVLTAVSQYRFAPGTLNHEPIAVPMNLEVTIQHGW